MNLFKKIAKTQNEKSFILEEHFRGFKAFPIVVHGDKDAETGNKKLAKTHLPGKTIRFVKAGSAYSVQIDAYHVGMIYDSDTIKRINKIEKVYAKIDEETVIGTKTTATRPRIHLFVKEKQ